ncbi:MAG: hypothetical protein IJ514_07825 [Clostridia bacterium]|nr:hypothetical protein [Clostridia bacterium]
MKRTFFKTVGLVLSLTTLFCVVGCKDEEEQTQNLATSPKILLNSYEHAKDMNAIWLNNGFGKMERSKDEAYVTEGEYSAKCTIQKSPWRDMGTPYLYQAATVEYKDADYTNFSNVSMLTLDVTNTDDEPQKIGLQIVYDFNINAGRGAYEVVGDTINWIDLASGYNLVNLNIIKDTIPEVTLEDGSVINQVKGINIYFERPEDEDKVFYIDNVCLHKTENPVKGEPRQLKENEICSFDQSWQYKLLTPNGGEAGDDYKPIVTWQNDIISPKADGGAAVKVSFEHIKSWPTTSSRYFVGLIMGSELLNYVDFSKYEGQDKFCFDLYVPEQNGIVMMNFSLARNNTFYFTKQLCEGASGALPLKRGWNHYEFTVDEINSGEKVTSRICFATTNKITFTIWTTDTPNGVFYLDNMRIERAQ